ncbi:MAG: hypothetical protein ACI4RA_03375 [Kiritimatiellia bacterium]
MRLFLDLFLYLGIWGVSALNQKYMLCAGLMFIVMVLDVFQNGMSNAVLLLAGNFMLLWMTIKDTQRHKNEALILKYNPLNEKSKISPRVCLLLLLIFVLAFIVRIGSYFVVGR